MINKQKSLSIVIPVYNGAATIDDLARQLLDQTSELANKELIFVDDGSSDKSWKKITLLKNKFGSTIVGVKLDQNFGQHNALMCGLAICRGDLIITMDDDLRHLPSDIAKLIHCQREKDADLVYGIEGDYAGTKFRATISGMVRKTGRYFSDHGFEGGSSFRLMTRELVDKIKVNQGKTIFIDEVVHWYTTKIEMVPLFGLNQSKKSRYSIVKLFRLYFQVVHNYASWPLKFMIFVGGISSLVTFLLGIRFIYKRLYLRVDIEGFTATIVAILFSASVILFCLGIVGLYIYKLYQIQSGKPSYTVREII